MIKLSFTWDDGPIEDLKLMELSIKHKMPGMFFIPAKNPERPVLPPDKVRLIDQNGLEIGAHTYSHIYLTLINPEAARKEITKGKDFLEQLSGKEISHFCFPGGKYNKNLVMETKKHFLSARTADTCSSVKPGSFLIKPSFHFFNRGKLSLIVNGMRNNFGILTSITQYICNSDYFEILKRTINILAKSDYEYRIVIWGHSWEIQESGLWKELEELFFFLHCEYPLSLIRYSDIVKP